MRCHDFCRFYQFFSFWLFFGAILLGILSPPAVQNAGIYTLALGALEPSSSESLARVVGQPRARQTSYPPHSPRTDGAHGWGKENPFESVTLCRLLSVEIHPLAVG
jgi:hypothetical protein